MTARRWRRLAALVQDSEIPRVEVGARVEVSSESFCLVLQRRTTAKSSTAAAIDLDSIRPGIPGLTAVPWACGTIEVRIDPGNDATFDETLDRDQVTLPLVVRAPEKGDRFEPLGMNGQGMPLADFFRGRHVNRAERRRVPLVCDQSGIIWVVGHRIADRVKVNEQTQRRLGLRWRATGADME